jgi:6-phosphogluconolactonase (cycloisomerase 2 family)
MKTKFYSGIIVALAILALFSSLSLVSASPDHGTNGYSSTCNGAVYTIDNAVTGNNVIKYDRDVNGALTLAGTFSTYGLGTGSHLASQGAVVLTDNDHWLLVVDAGSNQISVFKVGSTLTFTDKVYSDGTMPVSIAIHDNLVYVLNAGGTPDIAGFYLSNNGKLFPIWGSIRPLSGVASSQPEQIGFNNDGRVLVVTEVAANNIDTYKVNWAGVASWPMVHASNGPGPYGFAFDEKGYLVVSEAGTGTLSSYKLSDNGNLKLISGSVPDFGLAPCWVAIGDHGLVYASNAHGGTISDYKITNNGKLVLISSVDATVNIPALDLAFSEGSRYLYSLNGNSIIGFWVHYDGSLTQVTSVSGVASSAAGLAAV